MTELSQEFYYLVEAAVYNLEPPSFVVERLTQVLNSLGSSVEVVQFTLEFYKHERPVRLKALLSNLIAKGCLKDASILNDSCFGPFMSELLFETVTDSAVECAKYCTQNWIDRITNDNYTANMTPNPLMYLNPSSPIQPSTMTPSSLLQFKVLDNNERKLMILNFRKLASLIPPRFYPRLAVAFFIFMEFYRHDSKGNTLNQEVILWTETWYNLLASSLVSSVSNKNSQIRSMGHPLHHILCALMISTNTLEFIACNQDALGNVLNSLELLRENSSGQTEKWIVTLLTELQSE